MTPEEMLRRFPTRKSHPRWSMVQALMFYTLIATPLSQKGWMVAMYGSTMRQGDGQDLDLIFWPWRQNGAHEHPNCINNKLYEIGYRLMDSRDINPEIRMLGFCGESTGHLLDIQIRFTPFSARWVPTR